MTPSATLLRRLLPALALASLVLTACEHHKEGDPRPHNKCGTHAPAPTPPPPPSGHS